MGSRLRSGRGTEDWVTGTREQRRSPAHGLWACVVGVVGGVRGHVCHVGKVMTPEVDSSNLGMVRAVMRSCGGGSGSLLLLDINLTIEIVPYFLRIFL